jgi:hypothetical protein
LNFIIREDVTAAAAAQALATRKIPAAVRYILQTWSADTVKLVKEGLAGRYLYRRTGHLANSVGRVITRKGDLSTATIGTNVQGRTKDVPYARIQDEGGVIRPRNARALAVPIAGTKGVPANFPNLFMVRRVGKPPLLVERTGKGAWRLRFVLLQRVTIKPTGWWTTPWTEATDELGKLYLAENVFAVAARLGAVGAGGD